MKPGALDIPIFEEGVTAHGQQRPFASWESSSVTTGECCLDVEVLASIWEQNQVGSPLPSPFGFFPCCGRTQ